MSRVCLFVVSCVLASSLVIHADDADDLARKLASLDAPVFSADEAKARQLPQMLRRDQLARIQAAHRREAEAFQKLKTKADWEQFRDQRLQALREALGRFPEAPKDLKARTTRSLPGDGYQIENIVFESRPGLLVTANLYSPLPLPKKPMPGILIIHGFHQPKSQGELQDMGVNWAKQGCLVLVPDQLCHGERRQHPFTDAKKFDGKFNVPRQDYYSRANAGLQLSLVGESLMGWMIWDAMRCIDLLLARPGIDKDKIIVLGAVAAGGDTAAVAAALDPRIAAVVPFNFGGPEPETEYPLPAADPEYAFPYALGGHWDSTRRLARSASDGFLPWVVVGAAAPRKVIYAHEFAWDHDHDPAYSRLERIFGFYDTRDALAFAHGSGTLFGKPEGTGCANIGPVHRKEIYPKLQRWFGIAAPNPEVQQRRPAEDFLCLTAETKGKAVCQIAAELAKMKPDAELRKIQTDWARLLGATDHGQWEKLIEQKKERAGSVTVERLALEVRPGLVIPLLLLVPDRKPEARLPVVVGVAQQGKQEFLKQNAAAVAELLRNGTAVCLPDLRGTGETLSAGDRRGPPAGTFKGVEANGAGTLLAHSELMLGQTLLGARVADLRLVLRYLRGRPDLDGKRLALWGDSFAAANPDGKNLAVPWDAEQLPAMAEPMGGLAVLLAALFEPELKAVYVRGSLASYDTLLQGQFCFVPPDVIVPGALAVGDLNTVAASLAPRPLRLDRMVDGQNRRVPAEALAKLYPAAGKSEDGSPAAWLMKQLK